MKKITEHHDGLGLNDQIDIFCGIADDNGVAHRYDFSRRLTKEELGLDGKYYDGANHSGFLQFQRGPRNVSGSTLGITTDAVLVALLDFLRGFQSGPLSSRETSIMITKLEEALMWSQKMAKDRAARGVLGKKWTT